MDLPGRVRLADVIAALSLGTDLGMGQPLGHQLGVCLAALELGALVGCGSDELRDIYYLGLLEHVGCTATSREMAAWGGGDDIALRRGAIRLGPAASPIEATRHFVRHLAEDRPFPERVGRVAGMLVAGGGRFALVSAAQCEAAACLAARLGMSEGVCVALAQLDERWDGKGQPGRVGGDAIRRSRRVVRVAHDLIVHAEVDGLGEAVRRLERRRGAAYDPEIVDVAVSEAEGLVRVAEQPDAWERVLDSEPQPVSTVPGARLQPLARAFAEFTDLKVPCLFGHSLRVAELAGSAVESLGCEQELVAMTRAAGLLHDVGRISVPNGIWEKPGQLGAHEQEQVRLHPYYTERILARSRVLSGLAVIAGSHHERLDGSGYHRGVGRSQLDTAARALGAADAYDAMANDRPHRARLSQKQLAEQLRIEVAAGRLDERAVSAVLGAAHAPPLRARQGWPGGLTEREVDVLRLLARGLTNKQMAAELVITEKTVGHHVEHIYAKANVSTRAGAALFASQHDLID